MKRLILLAAALGPIAFGQLDSNSLSLTVSRSAFVQPDQAVFGIGVAASPDVTLTEILTGMQKVGLRSENLLGIETMFPANRGGPGPLQWSWQFSLPVPLANIGETLFTLLSLQRSADTANRGLQLSFALNGIQASPASVAAQQCPLSDMIAEARSQGQKMASAAGSTLGPLLAIGEAPTPVRAAAQFVVGSASFQSPVASPVATCSISVKFRLGG